MVTRCYICAGNRNLKLAWIAAVKTSVCAACIKRWGLMEVRDGKAVTQQGTRINGCRVSLVSKPSTDDGCQGR